MFYDIFLIESCDEKVLGEIMSLIDNVTEAFRFKETIFYKANSDLQERYDALKKLAEEYPNNDGLLNELFLVKKGLDGENEIAYQLKKAHIGMYVLRDMKFQYEDLTSQIDYVVITPVYIYYIECKNLVGNITVTDKGDFIREISVNGKKVRKGMYSPLRQVEAQREVMRKIWESRVSKVTKILASKHFDYYRRVFVVVANQETILDTRRAPKDIKYKILRADALVRQIEYDIQHRSKGEPLESRKSMERIAQNYIDLSSNKKIDYYVYYQEQYCKDVPLASCDDLKERLLQLRTARATEMRIPAYYVFTNDELEQLIAVRPTTIAELKAILPPVKVNTHGEAILEEINKKLPLEIGIT